jgi:hypothetical protein
MRTGLVFVGLLAVLLGFYALAADTLGNVLTFGLQAAIVGLLLAGSKWLRRRTRGSWRLFGEPADDGSESANRNDSVPKIS